MRTTWKGTSPGDRAYTRNITTADGRKLAFIRYPNGAKMICEKAPGKWHPAIVRLKTGAVLVTITQKEGAA